MLILFKQVLKLFPSQPIIQEYYADFPEAFCDERQKRLIYVEVRSEGVKK